MNYLKTLLLALLFAFSAHEAHAQQPKTKVTLGIKPDYWYTMDGTGVRIDGVLKDQIAQKVGMKEGDIIVAFNDKSIKDIFEYKKLLEKSNPGDKVKVKVLRNQKAMYFDVTF